MEEEVSERGALNTKRRMTRVGVARWTQWEARSAVEGFGYALVGGRAREGASARGGMGGRERKIKRHGKRLARRRHVDETHGSLHGIGERNQCCKAEIFGRGTRRWAAGRGDAK